MKLKPQSLTAYHMNFGNKCYTKKYTYTVCADACRDILRKIHALRYSVAWELDKKERS